jgi:microcystin-dependent protein
MAYDGTKPANNSNPVAADMRENFRALKEDQIVAGIVPVGGIMAWPTSTPPAGFLHCNGQAVSRTTYASLFAVISDDYGPGNGSTTFNVPDLRGEFLRGWDNGAGTDPDAASRTDRGDGTVGDNVGTKQADELKAHTHPEDASASLTQAAAGGFNVHTLATGVTGSTGGNETRPTNVGMMFVIKT